MHQLINEFSGVIAREIRTQRRFQNLQSRLDSDVISQSVWRCFFGAVLSSQVAFDKPRDLAAYLTKLTHNKIESQFRKHLAIKRDIRRTLGSHQADLEVQAEQSQSQSLGTIEFLQLVLGRMSAEERLIAERRADGAKWEQIAWN